jgi:Uma2 family endonuclease
LIALDAGAGPELRVLPSPYDWVVGPGTLFQPDLVVARRSDFGLQQLERPPLLVVEVLSPSTRRIDMATKRMAYADEGVASYWLFDPDIPSLTVLGLVGARYEEMATAVGDEAWESQTPIVTTIIPSRLVN